MNTNCCDKQVKYIERNCDGYEKVGYYKKEYLKCSKCNCILKECGTGINLYICGKQVFGASLCKQCVTNTLLFFSGK